MKCGESHLLSGYHDGELSAELERHVTEHLERCDECRAELAVYQQMSAVFMSAPRLRLSTGAYDRIVESVSVPGWVRLMLPVARPFAAAAGILLAVGLPALVLLGGSAGSASGMGGMGSAAVGGPVAPAAWEATALSRDPEAVASLPQSQFAEWMASDLSGGSASNR
jgi:anti-sigma factor RsiW